MDKLKCLVIGVGHLGRHHARILATMPNTQLAAVIDPDAQRGGAIAQEYSAAYLPDLSELKDDIDAAVIAAPTFAHFELAAELLRRGVAVMVEKPMTSTLQQADDLIEIAARHNTQLHVGHVERFNPAILAIKKHIDQPIYIECDRIGPFGFRCMDVGVVLDLMIHDLDMVLHLSGSEIDRIDAIGVPVISKHEDVANARIKFNNGCIANLTASRVAIRRERKMRIFQADAYFSLDSEAKEAKVFRRPANFTPPEQIDLSKVADPKALVYEKMLIAESVPMTDSEPLRNELEAFVNCIINNTAPEVGGEDGRKAIAAAEEIIRQVKSSSWGNA